MEIPKTMKAIVTYGPKDYRLEEVAVPEIGEGEILIKVEGCGICAGDVKAYRGGENFWGNGETPPSLTTPAIGGHEFIGTIVKLGPNTEQKTTYGIADNQFSLGDRVAVEQIEPCGECRYCKEGRYSLCVPHNVYGFKNHLHGGFAEYAKLTRNSLVYKIPHDLPLKLALVIEPYSCSMNAINRAKIQPDDVVVISGAGCLGLGMMAIAKNLNVKHLVSLDLNDQRLAQAREFGADITINPNRENVYQTISELTNGYGCDVYIEATGYPSSVVQGLKLIKKGGNFVEFSLFMDATTVNWSTIGDEKELNLYGASLSPRCYPKVIEGICSGKIKAEGVVTHEFRLDDYIEAFETSAGGVNSIKVAFVNQ